MASGAIKVATGILLSRISGFVREVVIAALLGATAYADVFRFLLRAPNLLQNLLGEQTLSAALIPVYSRRLAKGDPEGARRLAGRVLGWLLVIVALLVVAGSLLAEPFVGLVMPGWLVDRAATAEALGVDRFALAVQGIRWMFPAIGFLVLSAWALAVLNSHRRFLVSYTAPIVWNLAIAGALIAATQGWLGERSSGSLLVMAGVFGVLVGSALQFFVQLPFVRRETGSLPLSRPRWTSGVGEVAGAMGPLMAGRGVVQLSAYLDQFLASFIAAGGISVLGYSQTLFLLPVALLGMSMAAAELPTLSRELESGVIGDLVPRIRNALRRTGVFAVPAAVGFLLLGGLLVRVAFQRGRFTAEDSTLTWLVLSGYSLGLVATIAARQLQNVFVAASKTKTPARIAVLRVVVSAAIGIPAMLYLDQYWVPGFTDGARRLGAVGLAVGSGIAAWVELAALRRALAKIEFRHLLPVGLWLRALALSLVAATLAWGLWVLLDRAQVGGWKDLATLGCYAASYVIGARLLGMQEVTDWFQSDAEGT